MTLEPGEPAAGPWRIVSPAELIERLHGAAGALVGRPQIVAIDGRGGPARASWPSASRLGYLVRLWCTLTTSLGTTRSSTGRTSSPSTCSIRCTGATLSTTDHAPGKSEAEPDRSSCPRALTPCGSRGPGSCVGSCGRSSTRRSGSRWTASKHNAGSSTAMVTTQPSCSSSRSRAVRKGRSCGGKNRGSTPPLWSPVAQSSSTRPVDMCPGSNRTRWAYRPTAPGRPRRPPRHPPNRRCCSSARTTPPSRRRGTGKGPPLRAPCPREIAAEDLGRGAQPGLG